MKQKVALPRSVQKHIRKQKARIRREFLDEAQRKEQIEKLYQKFVVPVLKKKPKKVEQPATKKKVQTKKSSD